MNDVKIIFFDIDGTLIDMRTKRISEKTIQTLMQLKRRGVILCLATGRSPITLPHFEGVAFDAYMTFNGAYCYDARHTIFSTPIPPQDVQTLVRNAAAIGRPVSLATRDRLAANGTDADLAEYFGFARIKLEVAEDFERVMEQSVYQVMLGCREEEYPAILNGVRGAQITAWWDRAVDVIPSEGGKGAAVQRILAYYHLNSAQAMAFGDGRNDMDMLRAVGTGVAMGNASAQVKAAADAVCGDVAEDGIYAYCVQHGLVDAVD